MLEGQMFHEALWVALWPPAETFGLAGTARYGVRLVVHPV